MLMARSIWEAQTYVSLRLSEREQPPGEPGQPVPALSLGGAAPMKLGTNLIEGPDSWTYQSPVGDIVIPYVSEKTTIQVGAPFGIGRSRLIDAAEWVHVAYLYQNWALADMLKYAGEPDPASNDFQHTERRRHIRLGWELAVDALLQATAFLPEGDHGGDQVPDSEIWSQFGRSAKLADPYLVTRARLEEDLETFRGMLEDFDNFYDAVD
ncbi:hypothetical protein JOF29_008635 [Kribbella aluminosa]|uniref:Uncharacterized protein n=1 Tax=Kribbella aluminosa TaxID=416017 RepID=A0ABS4V0U7_9ACTN|nr:hypothetical protein [Kribbella aluminosa]MBP2357525.1 hypothetical protein [Kribbella aluminosa]